MALAMLVMALAVLLIAACAPATLEPTAVPPAAPTAAPPATQPPATPVADVPAPADTRPTVPAPPADTSRPLADLQPLERADRFSGPAAMTIKPDTIYLATFVTAKGNIVAELYQDTPQSANNFITLAGNGFYDGLTFHRVEPGFVIQGGDPMGDGSGGPGYTIPAEINHTHPRGALAWARTGDPVNPERRSSGSQFYVTLADQPGLDQGGYTVFGQVVAGMDVVDQIAVGDVITRVEISESTEPSRLPTPTPTPEPKAPVMEEGRPLAQVPVEGRDKIYNMAPELIIDTAKSYQATLTTAKGEIVIDLDPTGAPQAVNSFVLLANLGFYDGLPVAYVESANYAVMGSPAAQPDSDVGYALEPEVLPEGSGIVTGTVSLYPVYDQLSGVIRASGSQFFISFALAPEADTPLSVIGQVTLGMDVATRLEMGDIITKIVITEK